MLCARPLPQTLEGAATLTLISLCQANRSLKLDGVHCFWMQVREAMRRMAQLERRISEQDEDFVDSRMARSRAEGKVLALQGRQVQLDAKARKKRNLGWKYFSEV